MRARCRHASCHRWMERMPRAARARRPTHDFVSMATKNRLGLVCVGWGRRPGESARDPVVRPRALPRGLHAGMNGPVSWLETPSPSFPTLARQWTAGVAVRVEARRESLTVAGPRRIHTGFQLQARSYLRLSRELYPAPHAQRK